MARGSDPSWSRRLQLLVYLRVFTPTDGPYLRDLDYLVVVFPNHAPDDPALPVSYFQFAQPNQSAKQRLARHHRSLQQEALLQCLTKNLRILPLELRQVADRGGDEPNVGRHAVPDSRVSAGLAARGDVGVELRLKFLASEAELLDHFVKAVPGSVVGQTSAQYKRR